MKKEYGFIIDTNSYAGNFEREMCAFMTGHLGDCEVGDKEAKEYLEEYSKLAGVAQKPDEYGCERPVEIFPTPNVWNNGLGFAFKKGEEELALVKYKEYKRENIEKQTKIVEGHRGKNIPTWTEDAINETIKRYEKELEDSLSLKEVNKYPSYQSVLIHFEQKIDERTIEFLKIRAEKYAEKYGNGLMITGYRILEQKEMIQTKFS